MTMMDTSLASPEVLSILGPLKEANKAFNRLFPGESTGRQPIHTVYGGAQIFKSHLSKKLGDAAIRSLKDNAPDPLAFARALGWNEKPKDLLERVYSRVMEKLRTEPVEDFRIDFEDGYGNRTDSEEDRHAIAAAQETSIGMENRCLPPFIGIRIKPFNEELHPRSLRTLDLFITHLLRGSPGQLPPGFVVTLPKVTIPEQVSTLAEILSLIETRNNLKPGVLKLEIMIETPQSIFNPRGEVALPILVSAGKGRCIGAHFGTYDYTASCNITAAHQNMTHPVCEFAKRVMQASLAGTGVVLSDGATNVMPLGPHSTATVSELSPSQIEENRRVVHEAWRLSHHHILNSLIGGFYQGWDLHPAQLPVRYATVFLFFLENLRPASIRLKNFVEKAAQATLVGDVFDDAATGQGLLNFFLRGINCGAITEDEAKATGLSLEEIRGRSFLKILESRKQRG